MNRTKPAPYLETQRIKVKRFILAQKIKSWFYFLRWEVKMRLKIFNEREQTTAEIEFDGKTVIELLNHLNLNPETVIVSRNSEVLTEKEILNENEFIEFISVISGG